MMRILSPVVAFVLVAGRLSAAEPWEIKTDGGYLRGSVVVLNAASAEQFRDPPKRGEHRFLAYDRDGTNPVVGKGECSLWEFETRGPDEFYIKAAEGKWKGWYLTTSDRAFKDGPSFGFLLEMGKKPQTFYVFQVAK